ncbi:hypothetical protein ACMA5I_12750 [Paracoccaceae bacterium GXU_MW_L88]
MVKWKSFRKIPPQVVKRLDDLGSETVKVIVAKQLTEEDIVKDVYGHVNLDQESCKPDKSWSIIPNLNTGRFSRKNVDGWEVVRKDLPKITKYYYQDILIYGDSARNDWTTVAIPREVYERDQHPPYLFSIEIEVKRSNPDGSFNVVFAIDEPIPRNSISFEDDLLFALNLLQENVGDVGIADGGNPKVTFTSELDWEVFPPENVDDVIRTFSSKDGKPISEELKDVIEERMRLFDAYEPQNYLRGMGGNDYYIGAKYSDDLVVFENLKYGNALYVLYEDWKELSQKSRSELLKSKASGFDRIVHTDGWENRFAVLMQQQLKDRGVRIRIGRKAKFRRR